ncbi:MAG: hypothetical protein JST45_01170 [Bacteroidetes bacterium]|nr:hypothetical protein [Bacteroidota bacterium]
MRTIKLIAAALLISAAGMATAQKDLKAEQACAEMTKARTELLTKELALDKDQAAKVHELLAKNEKELEGMRGHCEMMDAKAKKADEGTYASIGELLNPEQKEKMADLVKSGKLDACGKEGEKGCCAGKKVESKGCCAGKAEKAKADHKPETMKSSD